MVIHATITSTASAAILEASQMVGRHSRDTHGPVETIACSLAAVRNSADGTEPIGGRVREHVNRLDVELGGSWRNYEPPDPARD